MKLSNLLILGLVLLTVGVGSGWKGRAVYQGYTDSVEADRLAELSKLSREFEAAVAGTLERKLAEMKSNVKRIHTIEKQVITRPVYTNVCIDDDGLQLIRAYASGSRNATELIEAMPN